MKRIRLLIAGLAGLVVAALAVSSVSWTSPVSLRLADESGQPATDAYVVFHYYGHVINPVHSVTYVARTRAIVKATKPIDAAPSVQSGVADHLPMAAGCCGGNACC